MEMVQGVLILVFMLVIMGLMVTRKMPSVIALIVLAIGICLLGGVPIVGVDADGNKIGFLDTVIVAGSAKLASSIIISIFAGWLGCIMDVTGITNTMIKKGAELGGDKTLVVTLILFAITSVLFSVVTGLGSVIMIGSIMIPILLAVGVDKMTAAGVLLFAYGIGNSVSFSTVNSFASITTAAFDTVFQYSLILVAILAVGGLAFIFFRYKTAGKKFAFSAPVNEDTIDDSVYEIKGVLGFLAILSPLLPILLVALLKIDTIPALIIGVIWATLMTCWKAGYKRTMNMLVKTFVDGFCRIASSAILMIGIGILLNAVNQPAVSSVLQPFMEKIVPGGRIGLILFFSILAPLAMYRGPLNMWGMGAGIAALIVGLGLLPPSAVMVGFTGVAILQVVCCPTNTHNAWVSGYVGEDVTNIMKKLIVFVWPVVIVGLIVGTFIYF